MAWYELFLWGLFGGFTVDGLEMWKIVKQNRGNWPKECLTLGYFTAEFIRLICGAGLAYAFGATSQVNGPLGAIAIGVTTPLIVEKFAAKLPIIPQPIIEETQGE